MSNIEIGIDLGTTNSEVAILNNGKVEIVKNTYGDEFTPSVFGVNKGKDEEVGKKPYQRYFKDATPDEIKNNKPEIKRLMGTKDSVYFSRIDKSYNAEEISSKILTSLKQEAIRKNEKLNTSAVVITIPAHFSTIQAEATKRAGLLAGFKHVVLLQEPIAAAISYGFGKSDNENWLVYDLGGGTFDVSILRVTKELKAFPLLGINTNGEYNSTSINIIGNDGDVALGGDDVDQYVTNYVLEKIAEGASLTVDRVKEIIGLEGLEELKLRLEKAKKVSQGLIIYELEGRGKFEIPILGEEVEEKCYRPIFDRTYELVARAMASTGVTSIDRIVLVGGSTKSYIIQKMLKEKFPHLHIMNSFEPDLSVALGASISTATSLGISKVATITDVVPMSIGVLADAGDNAKEYVKILKKDKSLPCIEEMEFNIRDTTQAISITVVQGESTFSLQTLLTIGNLQIQPEQYNGNSLTIGFKCDLNGVLSCYAIIGEKVMPIEIEYSANSKSKNTSDVIEGLDKLDKGQKHFFEMHLKKLVNAGLTNEELAEWTPEVVLGGFKDATAKFKELIAKH